LSARQRPAADEFAPFFAGYVSLVPEIEVLPVLAAQTAEIRRLAASIPADREQFRYAAGKWSIREMLGHIGDGERVFGYRAFCISRGEQASLPGFDENDYIAEAAYDAHPVAQLVEDFAGLRASNLAVLDRLSPERWSNAGVANGNRISLRALAYIMAGHVRHHLGILRTRYAVQG
jgi:hypothetical protein